MGAETKILMCDAISLQLPIPNRQRRYEDTRTFARAVKRRRERTALSNRQDFVKSWGDQHPETDTDRERALTLTLIGI
jgi:hypothetical protein